MNTQETFRLMEFSTEFIINLSTKPFYLFLEWLLESIVDKTDAQKSLVLRSAERGEFIPISSFGVSGVLTEETFELSVQVSDQLSRPDWEWLLISFPGSGWPLGYAFRLEDDGIRIILMDPGFKILSRQEKKMLNQAAQWFMHSYRLKHQLDADQVKNRHMEQELHYANIKIEEANRRANTDPLTGLFTRRHFMNKADEIIKNRPEGDDLCVAMIDIDNFKACNDNHGHIAGDQVLHILGQDIQAWVKTNHPRIEACRWGGEEFAFIIPGNLKSAASMLDRLRETFSRNTIQTERGEYNTTLSGGVEKIDKNDSLLSVLNKADKKLYEAKARGKNQIISHWDEP